MTNLPDQLSEILELYRGGQYLQAYELAKRHGPLDKWTGTEARILAGRLAAQLGAPRLADLLHIRAWRQDPTHPLATYYFTARTLRRHGPFQAWELLQKNDPLNNPTPETLADWYSLTADVLGHFRDFSAAHRALARAEEECPDNPWNRIEKARVLELEDRYDDALATAQEVLALYPWYPAGIRTTAHLLGILGRCREAVRLLEEASRRLESAALVAQLAHLQAELGCHTDAIRSYERVRQLSPLMEDEPSAWLDGRISDSIYLSGDVARAVDFAQRAGKHLPFYKEMAQRMSSPGRERRRTVLPVGFVRQHQHTCSPAVVSAITAYWSRPVEHLALARKICYYGTPIFMERQWAEDNMWLYREFSLTWETIVRLIDRGIPVIISRISPFAAHTQAVIGYDTLRRTFLIRDPSTPYVLEETASEILKREGPLHARARIIVPVERANLLDGLELPEQELFDRFFRVNAALERHDTSAASIECQRLESSAAGHWLALVARARLREYDQNPVAHLELVEELIKVFPEDRLLQLQKHSLMQEQADLLARLSFLESHFEDEEAGLVFQQEYALEIDADARQQEKAARLLRSAARSLALAGRSLHALAGIWWSQRRWKEAAKLYRLAACLEDRNEQYAMSYFLSAMHTGQTEEALSFLADRFARLGELSGGPAATLYGAYCHIGRTKEALSFLDRALELRPDDGNLILFTADAYVDAGKPDEAARLLGRAEGRVAPHKWARSSAKLAEFRGETENALTLWQKVVEIQPLAVEAHRSVARLLAQTTGRDAALEYLRAKAAEFPKSYSIQKLLFEWLRDDDPETAEKLLRHIVNISPLDAWAHRELASLLAESNRMLEANATARLLTEIEPHASDTFALRGYLHLLAGEREDAKKMFRKAILLCADNDYAIDKLLEACWTYAERREQLEYVHQELRQQATVGDGLIAYYEEAQDVLNADELLAALRKVLEERPDVWASWSVVMRQLTAMKMMDEALAVGQQAVERFPFLPTLWLDFARVYRFLGRIDSEIEAIEKAIAINPSWSLALGALADAWDRRGDWQRGRQLLLDAMPRLRTDAPYLGIFADFLLRHGKKEEAFGLLESAMRLGPAPEWAWRRLCETAREIGRTDVPPALARELTERWPHDADCWIALGDVLANMKRPLEAVDALKKAVSIAPRSVRARDRLAELLAHIGRFEEALAACKPVEWGENVPPELKCRAARVEAERGDFKKAIMLIEDVVDNDPENYLAWRLLADWYEETKSYPRYLEAARTLVKIAPHNPVSYAYLGHAKLHNHDRVGAKAEFKHAIEIAPDYGYAGKLLFDLQLEDKELESARETLETLRKHLDAQYVLPCEVKLAAAMGDMNEAAARLSSLFATKLPEAWPYEAGLEAATSREWKKIVGKVLSEALQAPDPPAELGKLWVEHCAAGKRWRACTKLIAKIPHDSEAWRNAAKTLLRVFAQQKHRWRLMRFIRRYRKELSRDNAVWGMVGFALLELGKYSRVVKWLADWEKRTGLEPWMLLNLAIALRHMKRQSEATTVSRRAVNLPGDHGRAEHLVLLAFDEAVAGNAAAAELQSRVDTRSLKDYYLFLNGLTQAMVEMQKANTAKEKRAAFSLARKQIGKTVKIVPQFRGDALLRRAYRACIRRVARSRGGSFAFFWHWVKMILS